MDPCCTLFMAMIIICHESIVYSFKAHFGASSNNRGELLACFFLLRWAIKEDILTLQVFGVSLWVIIHLLGSIRITSLPILSLATQLREIVHIFQQVDFKHIYRENNHTTDIFSKEGLDLTPRNYSLSHSVGDQELVTEGLLQSST